MSSLREIKRKIKSVRNIQQITKAMKMVAAARIKKAETALKSSKPYAYKLKELISQLLSELTEIHHPLIEERTVKTSGLILVSADKGLCGSYNHNLLRLTLQFIKNNPKALFLILGIKGIRFFNKRKIKAEKEIANWKTEYSLAKEISKIASDWFINKKVDEVKVIYTKAVSALIQKTEIEKILPFPKTENKKSSGYIIFEPPPDEILKFILPKYLETAFYQILLEAKSSELAARLKAMTNATDNAEKYSQSLTLQFFRLRQEAITREIIEVSSGAKALSK
ncbi:MAG: ATP synthase F1 subunit gamma [Armatimonadetes bacterium]|nr:ATP synthase F1 subunit gamma [Armatimonadota bacterium]